MLPDADIHTSGFALYQALRNGQSIPPLTDTYSEMTIDDAYSVSLNLLERRLSEGERVIGKKIGVTSKPVMDMLGVNQPDFGFLTDAMWARDNVIDTGKMILPRAEAEIAFRLRSDLKGPGVSETDIFAATEAVAACFEVVDSRITDWKVKIQDTVADNASCGTMAISSTWVNIGDVDLPGCKAVVTKNGQLLSEGLGAATLGSPLTAVAWVLAGDKMHVSIDGIGDCEVSFV